MANIVEQASTITSKGQTTVPKAVRQALGVRAGGKLIYRIEGKRVTLHPAEREHVDPALRKLLKTIERDIAAGRNIREMPASLIRHMRKFTRSVKVDLEEPIEGDVPI